MEISDDDIYHFGVKGMKWGVRKKDDSSSKDKYGELVLKKKTKNGTEISVYKNRPNLLARGLSKLSANYAEGVKNYHNFTFRDKDGKKVGQGGFAQVNPKELYLEWIGIKSSARGNGYASAAMGAVVKFAKEKNIEKLTLEFPTNAPDARHIYEKLGFKMDNPKLVHDPQDIAFGGLNPMTLDLTRVRHAQEDEQWTNDLTEEFFQMLSDNVEWEEWPAVEQADGVEDFLAHFGIKGMKWGVRKKTDAPQSADAAQKTSVKEQVKKDKIGSVSSADLRKAIDRMQLEQNYKRLAVNEQPAAKRFITSTILEIGKREVQQAAAKSVAKAVAKKLATGGLA